MLLKIQKQKIDLQRKKERLSTIAPPLAVLATQHAACGFSVFNSDGNHSFGDNCRYMSIGDIYAVVVNQRWTNTGCKAVCTVAEVRARLAKWNFF